MLKKRILAWATALTLAIGFVPSSPLAAQEASAADPVPPLLPIYKDQNYSFAERAAYLVSQMSLTEKAAQLLSQNSPAIPRLGLRGYTYWNEAIHGTMNGGTMYPTSLTAGSSWDKNLYYREAQSISSEIRDLNINTNANLTFFSPTVNLARDPRWGRNDESYGEDAFLVGKMGTQFVAGMEGKDPETGALLDPNGYNKLVTTTKHYSANNSERNRLTGGADMTLREMREYYTAPYRDIVKNVSQSSLMTAYSHVNKVPASLNSYILDTLLRQTWGFNGYVVSDCDSVSVIARHRYTNPHTGKTLTPNEIFASALAHGEDMQCSGGHGWGSIGGYSSNMPQMLGLQTDMGVFTENTVDYALQRIMETRIKLGEYENTAYVDEAKARGAGTTNYVVQSPARYDLAQEVAEGGIVMLKNTAPAGQAANILPLSIPAAGAYNVVIIGQPARSSFFGGYSGGATNIITIEQGIIDAVKKANPAATVTFHPGFLNPGTNLNTFREIDPAAVALAGSADLVIVTGGTDGGTSKEDGDRVTTRLPGNQGKLISAIGKANPNTVAVLETCGPITASEFDADVAAIVWSGFSGIRKGAAYANVLFGNVNPSGKLTATWHFNVEDDTNLTSDIPDITDYSLFPSATSNGRTYMYYTGAVKYPFGYGLSYTTFDYSGLSLDKGTYDANDEITATFSIKNSGSVKGAEAAQLYVAQTTSKDGKANRPAKRLLGFEKVTLDPGQSKSVTMKIKAADLAFYDEAQDKYVVDQGGYELQVGKSSADVPLKAAFSVNGAITPLPQVVTFKPTQESANLSYGDAANGISQRLIFGVGKTILPNIAVAMNDESLYGTKIVNNVSDGKALVNPHVGNVPLPAGMTVAYSAKHGGVVSIDPDTNTVTAVAPGVDTITATVTYNGKSATGSFVVVVESGAEPDGIEINGKALPGYEKQTLRYSVSSQEFDPATASVSAISNGNPNAEYTVTAPSGGIATVVAKDKATGKETVYTIGFSAPLAPNEGGVDWGAWTWDSFDNATSTINAATNKLSVTTQRGAFGTNAQPKNLYNISAAGDWSAKTKIALSAVPSAYNQQAGLAIYDNADNYAYLVYERGPSGRNTVSAYSVTSGGAPVPLGSLPWDMPSNFDFATFQMVNDPYYLLVVKSADTYEFLFSTNDKNWTSIGSAKIPLALPKLTVWANNGNTNAAPITATYDGVKVYDNSKSDPKLLGITIGGTALAGFSADIFDYTATGGVANVAATAADGYTVEITQATAQNPIATVNVLSPTRNRAYTITFSETPTSDSFVAGTMDGKWKIVNENKNGYSIDKGLGLRLPTQAGDIAGGGTTDFFTGQAQPVYNIFTRPAAGNWEAVAKMYLPETFSGGGYQQLAFMAYQDNDNYVKVVSETATLFTHTGFEKDGGWISTDSTNVIHEEDNTFTIYYRIKKDGNKYYTAFSRDGKNYHEFNPGNPIEINLKNPQIAVFATSNTGWGLVEQATYTEYVEITALEGLQPNYDAMLQKAFDNVASYFFADIPTTTSEDLTFSRVPRKYYYTLNSSNTSVISNDGKVTPQAADTVVALEVTLNEGSHSEAVVPSTKRTINITVPGTGEEPAPTLHTVTFDSNGGTAVAAQTVTDGALATEPTAPTKTGFTFGGWYKEATLTTAWKFAADTVAADITLYAKWTDIQVTPVFEDNAGIGGPASVNLESGRQISYTISVGDVKSANVFEIAAKFDSSKLSYLGCDLALPANLKASFLKGPAFNAQTGDFTATVSLLSQGTILSATAQTPLISVNFMVKDGVKGGEAVKAELYSAQVTEIFNGGKDATVVSASLDPASAETALIDKSAYDMNGDGKIGMEDVGLIIFNYYLTERGEPKWADAMRFDANNDGIIDLADIMIVISNFG